MPYGPTSKFQSAEQEKLFSLLAKFKTADVADLLDHSEIVELLKDSKKPNDRKFLYMRLRGRIKQLFDRLKKRNQPMPI